MNEFGLENRIQQFKDRVDGLPLDDVLYYQEEFRKEIKDKFGIEIEFENGDVLY